MSQKKNGASPVSLNYPMRSREEVFERRWRRKVKMAFVFVAVVVVAATVDGVGVAVIPSLVAAVEFPSSVALCEERHATTLEDFYHRQIRRRWKTMTPTRWKLPTPTRCCCRTRIEGCSPSEDDFFVARP